MKADDTQGPHQPGAGPISIVYRRVQELKLRANNPRKHSPKQIHQLGVSIRSFGFNMPLLIDDDDRIIAGHGRLLAAQKLGLAEVPTVCLKHLTEAQTQAYMIADNRLTEISEWDDELLAQQLKTLSLLDLDFDLEATGFESADIDFRIQSLTDSIGDDDLAELVSAQPSVEVTRPGDQWLLHDHHVICGNALESGVYATLMANELAAMVITDPPYNVPIHGHASGRGAIQHREFPMACGELSPAEFTRFLMTATSNLARYSRDGSLHYIFEDWRHLDVLLAAGTAVYSGLENICVWVKSNGGMGSFYRSQHEHVLVFKKGKTSHRNNVQLGRFGRNRTNVWQYPGGPGFGRAGEEGNLAALHPTVKPVALIADAILDASSRGDIVLDAFLGSGTTLVAAERTGRRCYGIEIDPLYVDTAIRRWQRISGRCAIHAASGRSFDDIAAEPETP